MLKLREVAEALPEPTDMGDRPNASGMARLMILVARDIAELDRSGRTLDQIEVDARKVMYSILDGYRI